MRRPTLLVLCSLVFAPLASAQDARTTGYVGVTPGAPHAPPASGRLARGGRRARRAEILTWPGFQPLEGGASRFFVQTTGAVTTEVHAGEGRVEVVFRGATIHLANSRLWLDTRHFETPVLRARLERRGHDMVLVMELRAAVAPQVSTAPGEGGFSFVFVDFPAGAYRPRPEAPVAAPTSAEASAAAPARPEDHVDAERPPALEGARD